MRDYGTSTKLEVSLPAHCFYAFACLDSFLAGGEEGLAGAPPPAFEDAHTALFVTWNLEPGSRLRGCIGTLEPRMLRHALKEYALTSARE